MSQENISEPSIKKQEDNEQSSNKDSDQAGIHQCASQTRKRIHRKSDVSTFIMKTYRILDDRKNSDIVQWADQGNCFIVKNKQKFQSQILPKFFKHRKFSSFVRQLNMYDFHKIRKEKEIPIFKHKYFKMGGIDLLHKIKRKSGQQPKEDECSMNNGQSPMQQHNNKPMSITSKNNANINNQIDSLIRQNGDIQKSIAELTQQINYYEMGRDRKKEKLMKIISAMIFFDLRFSECSQEQTLRKLQQHFIKDQEPWNFSEYSEHLSSIYSQIKRNIQ